MATRVKAEASDLYECDVYAWAEEQAALIRARQFGDLDLEHLIEEIEDVGGSLYREVRSRVRTVIQHLLKLEHSRANERKMSWHESIRRERDDLADALTPTLRPRIEANLTRFYVTARIEAAAALREHSEHAAAHALPQTCPYSFDQLTGDWWPLNRSE